MPHLVLELSATVQTPLDHQNICRGLHAVFTDTGLFKASALKSRVVRHNRFFIGDGKGPSAFVHLEAAILKGKPLEVRKDLGEKLHKYLAEAFSDCCERDNCQITVEIREIDPDGYVKF